MATKDMYANMAAAKLTLTDGSIVGTQVELGISLGTKKGVLIDRIDYYLEDAKTALSDGKDVDVGWSTQAAASLSEIEIDNKSIIHYTSTIRKDFGTAANSIFFRSPEQYEFTPPIILAAPSIYLVGRLPASSGATGQVVRSRLSYRYIDLSTQEYLELAEAFILVG